MHIEIDLHTHSVASGHAYSTIRELAFAASRGGLKAIAVTDHGPAMPGAAHPFCFGNLRALPAEIEGVRILRGMEANIVDVDGRLDLTNAVLETLDFVAVGFHAEAGYEGGTADDNTRALLAVMRNPHVDMITHPCDRRFPINLEQVMAAAARYGTIFELNNRSFSPILSGTRDRKETCLQMIALAKTYRVPIALNSDAHFDADVGACGYVLSIANEGSLGGRTIINADYNIFTAHMAKRGLASKTSRLAG